jgi:hypothetical protein
MIEVPFAISELVFSDGLAALRDRDHPCHSFVQYQRRLGCRHFQLPDPFCGRRSLLDLVFVGKNPGLSPNEFYPVSERWNLLAYDEFFRSRFESRNAKGQPCVHLLNGRENESSLDRRLLKSFVPPFWRDVERFGREITGSTSFRLGEHALLIEIVRFKRRNGWLGDDQAERSRVWAHERRLTRRILHEVRPRLVIVTGMDAFRGLSDIVRIVPEPPVRLQEVLGIAFRSEDPPSSCL